MRVVAKNIALLSEVHKNKYFEFFLHFSFTINLNITSPPLKIRNSGAKVPKYETTIFAFICVIVTQRFVRVFF